ncbi:hypothetical protein GWJ21_14475 [Bacillus coagulans]|uniref:SMI1/KNR4 family protein n=1 Tax=Heyndrickxia coagulans TaxID=1398 RepID=UPI00077978FF|nr:SMI1/KNR4 family protein [Heyndrickxia coagulans]NCG69078.1 hypothetical protein [Heyndrickxia coagulans]
MENTIRDIIVNLLTKLEVKEPKGLDTLLRGNKLALLEQKYNISLPNEYKTFLESYDEIFFENDVSFKPIEKSSLTTKDGRQYFDGFLGLESKDSIFNYIESYKERMPDSLIPIGECPGGNLICIGVKEPVLGKVFFWDHESEASAKLMIDNNPPKDINLYWDNLFLVSKTFIDFLRLLTIHNKDNEEEDYDVEDIELLLDDDLLSD